MVFTIGGTESAIAGEWFPLRLKGVSPDEWPELLIRAVPPAKQRELGWKILGRKQHLRHRTLKESGKRIRITEQEFDNEQSLRLGLAGACFALVDVRRFTCQPGTPEIAAVLSKALGHQVAPQDEVTLDGRLTDEIKVALFEARLELLEFVTEKAEAVGRIELEDESAAGEI